MGSRLSPTTAHELQDLHNTRRPPYQCAATGRISAVKRTMGICICATIGVSTTTPRRLRTWRCTTTGMSTWSKNWTPTSTTCTTGTSSTMSKNCTTTGVSTTLSKKDEPRRQQPRHVSNLVQQLNDAARPAPPYPCTIREPALGLPGAALDKENVRRSIFCTAQHHAQNTHHRDTTPHTNTPWTDVIMNVASLETGLWGPRVPLGNNFRGSVTHHWTHRAAPAEPLAAS